MFSHYFQSIEYVTLYPIVALVMFMIVFLGALIRALKADKEYIRTMEQLPLETGDDVDQTSMKGIMP